MGFLYNKKMEFPIIYYHDIVEGKGCSLQKTNLQTFEKQMKFLVAQGYKPILFSEIEEYLNDTHGKEKVVLITFDDGYLSNFIYAYPIIKRLNLKINIFINTKMIEDKDPNFMSVNMLKEMYSSGLVEFGSHTHSHIEAKNVTEDELIKEIKDCNKRIKKWLGYNTEDFCYPYGFYSQKTNGLLANYYKRIYTSDCKPLEKINNSLIRGRIGISTDDTRFTFKNKLKGNYDVMYLYYKRINPN